VLCNRYVDEQNEDVLRRVSEVNVADKDNLVREELKDLDDAK
jgi:hypothetical protein